VILHLPGRLRPGSQPKTGRPGGSSGEALKEMGRRPVEEKTTFTQQQYAIRLLQMLQDFSEDLIKIDTVIIIVKMLSKHPIDFAAIFATGDAYKLGAMEFDDRYSARRFIDQMSDNVVYATIVDGEFTVYQYPYRSRVMQEWVFVELDSQRVEG
jgi:hypothetical protein